MDLKSVIGITCLWAWEMAETYGGNVNFHVCLTRFRHGPDWSGIEFEHNPKLRWTTNGG
jgi:hypothetical protein